MANPVANVTTSSNGTSQIQSKKSQLKSEDFVKLMITQLKNQDPMEPTKNQELLAQMSQIGQLQSSTQMQEVLKNLSLQSQIGSAGNLIGRKVSGLDDGKNAVSGVVKSVRVEQDTVSLNLDSGKTLQLGNVTAIAEVPLVTATASRPAAIAA